MTNEQYLIVSYISVGLLSVLLGWAAYLWLRRPYLGVAESVVRREWVPLLRRVFPATLILLALTGFLSVNYRTCTVYEYEKIVENRSYLVAKNREQISEALSYLALAVMGWGFVLLFFQRRADESGRPAENSKTSQAPRESERDRRG